MRVLFVTAECYPLIKTGGLADVAGALPLALGDLGCDVRVLLPAYPGVLDHVTTAQAVAPLPDLFGTEGRLLAGRTAGGLQVLALDAPELFDRPGNPYLGPDGLDWPDNHRRFGALSWVGAKLAGGLLADWRPDLVHAHDWQAGLTPTYLALDGVATPSVMTIHNIAFQGLFAPHLLGELRLPTAGYTPAGFEFYGRIGFLKAGLQAAGRLTTVSPTYAREIRTPEHGMGLDGVLRARAAVLSGIVNGIDDQVWNPATDGAIAAAYEAGRPAGKAVDKAALQQRLGLSERADAPVFCVISRLTGQKGMDLVLAALPTLLAGGGQLAVLGSGDEAIEAGLLAAARDHPGQVGVVLGYDEPLAHQIQAGADAILVPSRFEPCGLTQLCGLRYGTIPIVARVGGLADTVIDANPAALQDGVATGFQFAPVDADGLRSAIARAFEAYADPPTWERLRERALTREVGWAASARRYLDLYREPAAGAGGSVSG